MKPNSFFFFFQVFVFDNIKDDPLSSPTLSTLWYGVELCAVLCVLQACGVYVVC